MKIISKRKDYYDWVAGKYGGGDPRVVYDRRYDTKLSGELISMKYEATHRGIHSYSPKAAHKDLACEGYDYETKYCIVAGKGYLLVRNTCKNQSWRAALSPDDEYFQEETWQPREPKKYISRPWGWREAREEWVGRILNPQVSDCLLEASIALQRPVFVISSAARHYDRASIAIEYEVPNLGELGFASAIPAEQMYQELSYFVGNTMQFSPDTAPPVEVSNSDKITQHGFDLKRSFRH